MYLVELHGAGGGERICFDSSLLQGSSWGMDLEQFNRHQVAPGRYLVDVYVNNTLVKSEEKIVFRAKADGRDPEPCLGKSLMQAAKLKAADRDEGTACRL